ncbi:MAG: phosphate ABC transporter permease subunit PstC [Victivallaceae bacterium]|nr:phosphate ABC transporter permease subunit PstC [Victivallaceae bacterium]MDD3116467.1 phosphate ABC transporter permease subunit PstC [Victivallaceae bacterium]MDD4316917.1 phosphate ABC transporter permease subunit PstC [Victivallaceae bacterium]
MRNRRKHPISPETIDRVFKYTAIAGAIPVLLLMVGFLIQLCWNAWPAFREFGFNFLISVKWDPVAGEYGALPAITGTITTTAIALAIAIPLSFTTALFLVDAPGWLGTPLSHAIDLLAAIPSIIYGMWGLFVLIPFMQLYIQPRLAWIPFMGEDYNGFGFATSGLILALMIMPFICAIMRDVFRMVPSVLREAVHGIGATRWETAFDVTMRYGKRGLLGGIFVGLGRAVGETMAVLFVIGNIHELPRTLFGSGTTIASTLAANFAEAEGMFRSVLFALGLVLLLMSFGVQIVAQWWLIYAVKKSGGYNG